MRLEHTEGTSRKFWEATLEGSVLHVRWGRLGTEGQSKSHALGDVAAARAERDKLTREKLRKGYVLVEDDAPASAAPPPAPPPPPVPVEEPAPVGELPSPPGSPPRPTPAQARALATTLAPSKRGDGGVLTWSLFRTTDGVHEFLEVSAVGRELEIARGKVGKQGRVRALILERGEAVEARVVRELARALAEGFVPGADDAPTPDLPSPEEALHRRAAAWLRRQARTAYVPRVEDGAGPLDGSRFGGLPALARDEEAPRCGHCREPFGLIVQLASASLPAAAREVLPPGLIQLLWCDSICQSEHGWEPFSPAHLVRTLPASGPLRAPAESEQPERVFAPRRVTGWSAVETYPAHVERASLGLQRSDEVTEAVSLLCEEGGAYHNRGGARLLGWMHWIQDVAVVVCRACSARMAPVLQVDSNTTLPGLSFGDTGIGFVMLCPACKVMTFVWQSC